MRMSPRFIVQGVFALAFACSGCSGGGGSTPPQIAPSPSPSPSPSPTPTPQDDDFPVSNTAEFNVVVPQGLDYFLTAAALGSPSTYAPTCSSAVGTFGDYTVSGELFVPDSEQEVSMLGGLVPVHSLLLLTKNSVGDALIVGEVVGDPNGNFVSRCVTPYPLIEAGAKAGQTWSYTDIAGKRIKATVVFDHQPRSYPNPPSTPSPFAEVTEVNYGSVQTIDWASGYGPVQITEHGAVGNEPLSYTAFNYTVVPDSK